ncbi:MAG: auxin-responsive protein [Erysipelotrichia bacterium]|nr:auxin-responsive protein [Erysipelotrichia bacterium]NCC54003.1 auxin-responsive protein [Erysipelotrichia bacterium]
MKLEEKLKRRGKKEIWNEYCGFLDLSLSEYMMIQKRLMNEQINLFANSGLGKQLLTKECVEKVDDFRKHFPLTTYDDYAKFLLPKEENMLPQKPLLWIQTTWEGGAHPIKVAPYSEGMLNTFKRNVVACLLLSTSKKRGDFNVKESDKILYGLAPLPYATGLLPLAFEEEIGIEFLPPVKDAIQMSFSQRNKEGFKLGLSKGIDYFFGLGSVTYYISKTLEQMNNKQSGGKTSKRVSPSIIRKLALAKIKSRKEQRSLLPKDLFKLKGFMVAGTDNACYKDDLEKMWGVRPMEVFAGTEPTCLGCEIWNRDGLYFFPDACFYEFIPYEEMIHSLEDTSYEPKSVLMDEVEVHKRYELVISVFKGGAFMRYRVGDMYQCIALDDPKEKIRLPRFQYIDRIPTVIDIAGFTRITQKSIDQIIKLSKLDITNYIACKEFNDEKRPYLHMYIECEEDSLSKQALSVHVLKEHLRVYFKYVDADYEDLQKILGVDPLQITILKSGTFAYFEKIKGKKLRKINPERIDVASLLAIQSEDYRGGFYGGKAYE